MREASKLVQEGIGLQGDLDSCLGGTIEDFVPDFEPLMAKKDEAFRKNRSALL